MSQPTRIHPHGAGRTGHNQTAADMADGLCVVVGVVDSITLPAAIDDPIWGVTVETIKAGVRGDVQRDGVALVRAGAGGFAAGNRLMPEAASGRAIPFAAGAGVNASYLGLALTTTAEDQLGEVDLAGPGASRQG